MNSTVQLDLEGVPLRTSLRLMLKQLGLTYKVEDGVVMITSQASEDEALGDALAVESDPGVQPQRGATGLMGGGMAGMGGGGRGPAQSPQAAADARAQAAPAAPRLTLRGRRPRPPPSSSPRTARRSSRRRTGTRRSSPMRPAAPG